MSGLSIYSAESINKLSLPRETRSVSLRASALEFFLDFNLIQSAIVDAGIPAIDLHNLVMHTRFALPILMKEGDCFVGILNSDDSSEQKIIQKMSKTYGRRDVCVKDLMSNKASLSVLNYEEIAKSTIGQVIEVLKSVGQRQCLAVDKATQEIRGMFAANDLSHKLKLDIDIRDKASFYRIFLAVTHKDSVWNKVFCATKHETLKRTQALRTQANQGCRRLCIFHTLTYKYVFIGVLLLQI